MEFGISGKSIKERSNSAVKLPVIVNKNIGQPETSPRGSIVRSAGRRPSGNGIQSRTSSANSENGEKIRKREESSQSNSKSSGKTPLKMQRARNWSPDIENLFRYQAAGFRDQEEYLSAYPPPQYWETTGFLKTLQAKQTGYFMYFRQDRECEDRHLNKIKIYSYGESR